MVRSKKAGVIARNKKLPLDSTPWEELSKNIKGKFKSKIEIQDEHGTINPSQASEDCGNYRKVDELNCQVTNNKLLKEVLSNPFDEPKGEKKKKQKILLETSSESMLVKDTHGHENNCINSSVESLSTKNSSCQLLKINDQEKLPVKKLSEKKLMRIEKRKKLKLEKKNLKRQKKKLPDTSLPFPVEKSVSKIQLETKKLPKWKKIERNKLYEKKRLERRKELGIMLLPKNIESRLLRVRKALRKKNLSPEEIKTIMRKERSKAQDEFRKSQSNQICFNCRESGHLVANCPLNENGKDISICIKCGSNEHKYAVCKMGITGFPFATCFICKGQGHISRDCPNNKHGIYPKGGKCNLCDSVNHLNKDCPTKLKKKEFFTLHTIDNGVSIDDEVMDLEQSTHEIKSEKPKVVTF